MLISVIFQHLKPQKIDFTPRKKKRRINEAAVKQIVRAEHKKVYFCCIIVHTWFLEFIQVDFRTGIYPANEKCSS